MVGGVAGGLATHLGIEAWVIRVAFVLLAFNGGAGVVAYVAFWALRAARPGRAARGRAVGRPPQPSAGRQPAEDQPWRAGPLLALGAIGLGALLLAQKLKLGPSGPVAIPLLVIGLGVAVLWRVADDTQRARLAPFRDGATTGRRAWVRVVVGIVLVVIGAAAVLGARGGLQAAFDGAGRRAGRRRRRRAGRRALAGPQRPRADRGATRADPLAGAGRARRARARLGPADADADPAQRRRPARGGPAGPSRGARAARLALPAARARGAGSFARGARARRGRGRGRPRRRRSRWWSSATRRSTSRLAALLQAAREAMVNAAKHAGTPPGVGLRRGRRRRRSTVFVRDRGAGLRRRRRARGPARRAGVDHRADGAPRRDAPRCVSVAGEGTEVGSTLPRAAPRGGPA